MKMHRNNSCATKAKILACLLAVTAFLAGSWQVRAQSPTQAIQAPSPRGVADPLAGRTPPPVLDGTAMKVEHYNPELMLRLAIMLTPPHPAEEKQFLEDIQDKSSPLFHKYLSAEEWNARFAPKVEDEQAVVDWATKNGLTITYRYKNRLIVDVEASAGIIEKALGITLNNYQLGDQVRYANDRDPVLPSPLDTIIQSVQGLNSFESVRPARAMHTPIHPPDYSPGPALAEGQSGGADANPEAVRALMDQVKSKSESGTLTDQVKSKSGPGTLMAQVKGESEPGTEYTPWSSSYGYSPWGIFSPQAYDYIALMNQGHCCNPTGVSGGTGPDTSIAVAGYATINYSDMTGFVTAFPYLAWHSYSYNIDGTYTCGTNDDGCGEITLDTEWSTATANSLGAEDNTATVYVYQGANYNDSTVIDVYNHILDDGYAKIMTTSWDCAENQSYSTDGDCYNATMVARDGVFQNMVGEGMTLINASGDEGATATWCEDFLGVFFPASDPNVVAAGGTFMEPYTNGDFYQEVAWTGGTAAGSCSKNNGGGTGGFSQYWGAPSFQTTWVDSSWTNRATPDFALNAAEAQGYYFNGSLSGVGGTSIVSPELAGFFAQENAYLLSLGNKCGGGSTNCAPIGNPNWVLYEEGHRNNAAHYAFYDTTSGCNSNDITAEYGLTAWCAGPGFDEATGWGSANMLQLAWALNWNISAFYSNGIPYATFSGPTTSTWYNTDQVVSWTIVDYAGNEGATSGTGIAGFTQGWDSIPSDPELEATPGDGNSFYDGPQYPNASNGCLAFNGADGCAGSPGQGCHTAHVRGWNNQGWTTGDATYGPICYDTVPPVTTPSLSGTLYAGSYVSPVKVTLSATDASSGVANTYYEIDAGPVLTYLSPFTVSTGGSHVVYYSSVDVAGNLETTHTVSFTISSPISLSATSLSFGSIAVGSTSASQSVTMTNNGSSGVSISSITLGGANASSYDFANSCGSSLAGGANCSIHGHFGPTADGSLPATITITDSALGSPQTIALSGTGTGGPAKVSFSATSLSFGNVPVSGSSGSQSVTMTNTGTVTLNVISIVLGGANASSYDFANSCGSSLAVGANCSIHGHFAPTVDGPLTATITITDNASPSPQTISVSGTGGLPTASLSATSLSFGNVPVGGTSASQSVTLTNNGQAALDITSIVLGGADASSYDFANSCGSTLAAGANCLIHGHFAPTVDGLLTGTITITDNASGSPQTISVSGTGGLPTATLSATSLSFGTVPVGGTSASQSVTLTNNGQAALNITSIVLGGADASSYDFANSCGSSLAVGANCSIHGHFGPTTTGTLTATITITDNASGSPQTIALSGTGH